MKNDYDTFYISLKPEFEFTDDEVYRMIKNPNNPVTAVIIAINLLQETKYVDMIKSDFDILSGKRSKGQIDFLGLS